MAYDLILCADDYALSPGVSRGILAALDAGRLNATSVMTTAESWPHAAAALQPFVPDVAVGLHFNLTLAAPLGPMPQFAANNRFPSLGRVIRDSLTGQLPRAELRAELVRQIDAFVAAFGRPPDYLDGHQHVQVLPGVRRVVIEELSARGWAGRLWLRDSADRLPRILARNSYTPKAVLLTALGAGFASLARAHGFQCNDGFAGFSNFSATSDYAASFARYLRAPGSRHLVMCHPGTVDAGLVAADPVTGSREQELRFLLSPEFATTLAAAGARLSRWDQRV